MNLEYNKDKWGELDMVHLVIDTDDYIVFVDGKLEVDWITSDEYDEKTPKDAVKHNTVLNKVALLECKPNGHFSRKVTIDYKRLLGEALARSLDSDYKTALDILNHAEIFITERGEELARYWQLMASGYITLAIVVVAAVLWLLRDIMFPMLGQTVFVLFFSTVGGAIGALLSIITRLGKENLNCHAGKTLHENESRFKIIAGMISAFIIGMCLYSNLFFTSIVDTGRSEIVIVLFGVIAGMSERLVPSISKKIEKLQI